MFGLLRKKRPAAGFWEWLEANTGRIQAGMRADPHGMSQEISRAFDQSYPDLVWEASVADAPPWLFCVSADGNRELFPRVEQAVREAPPLSGWTVQAFRPRGALEGEIDMGGRTLGYGDVWCEVEPLDGGVGVTLCVRGLVPEVDESLSAAAAVLLDNAVGEYDATIRIMGLARAPLPANPQRTADFFPLAELPKYLDRLGG